MTRKVRSFFARRAAWQSFAAVLIFAGGLLALATYALGHTPDAVTAHLDATSTAPAAVVAAPAPNPFANIQLTGQAAIVVDLTTGETLYSENANVPLPLASLTKLITTYAAVNVLSPNDLVTITDSSLAQDGDYGLSLGQQFTFKDLIRFALVGSSNDAAQAIAEAAAAQKGESVEALLANAISSAGLSSTRATNGTGLDVDAEEAGAYGTARDVAKLASEVLKQSPTISAATTKTSVTVYATDGTAHTLPNTDTAVSRMPGLLLSKTGYTDLAGGNLAVVFDAGINHPVAVVVLGSTVNGRFADVQTLMHATLAHFAGVKAS